MTLFYLVLLLLLLLLLSHFIWHSSHSPSHLLRLPFFFVPALSFSLWFIPHSPPRLPTLPSRPFCNGCPTFCYKFIFLSSMVFFSHCFLALLYFPTPVTPVFSFFFSPWYLFIPLLTSFPFILSSSSSVSLSLAVHRSGLHPVTASHRVGEHRPEGGLRVPALHLPLRLILPMAGDSGKCSSPSDSGPPAHHG